MRFFRYGIALLVLSAAIGPAWASEWWYVNNGANRVLFIDAKSIEHKHHQVAYWTMYVYGPGVSPATEKAHMQVDCAKRWIRFLSNVRYDSRGDPIGHVPSRPGRRQRVPPDSFGDAEMHFACGDEGDRVANDQFPLAMDAVTFAHALIARYNKPEPAHALHDELIGRTTPPPVKIIEPPLADVILTPAPAPDDKPSSPSVEGSGEASRSCANEPAGNACRELAEKYANGDGVPKDPARAAILLGKSCERGNADACTSLGIAYRDGEGVQKDLAAATANFARACELGGPTRCVNVGLAFARGEGVPRDVARAIALFKAACDKGEAFGCSSLGVVYSRGDAIPPDPRRARALFERSCKDGDANGCYSLAVVYRDGLGIKKDPAHAATLFDSACRVDDARACGALARLAQNGVGAPMNAVRAARLYQKACNLANAKACLDLGRVYQAGSGVERDPCRAAAVYRQALTLDPDLTLARQALGALKADCDPSPSDPEVRDVELCVGSQPCAR